MYFVAQAKEPSAGAARPGRVIGCWLCVVGTGSAFPVELSREAPPGRLRRHLPIATLSNLLLRIPDLTAKRHWMVLRTRHTPDRPLFASSLSPVLPALPVLQSCLFLPIALTIQVANWGITDVAPEAWGSTARRMCVQEDPFFPASAPVIPYCRTSQSVHPTAFRRTRFTLHRVSPTPTSVCPPDGLIVPL
ncbi:hypothetical protein CABS01_05282 [Colletotrichum abscissum]|uniref:uncharacterized protein n=1 Tax=Colletotrichum abscissum TaxID=1671311 RepID=UPI0027D48823|nr:uncharacterized protein CABS01_05282 [Colletotrichum abscissum]KAI3551564.1 hypothetical protein CSPX01_00906 [Colletotrichum filicis]KAK1523661.1 hypothetical protein CABS01_05282 [Colletotrichum abscissum]